MPGNNPERQYPEWDFLQLAYLEGERGRIFDS
jgi:hypothetical protein